MTSRTRLWVLLVSTPVIAFILVGGYLGQAMAAKDDTLQHLRVFEDVVGLVINNYVEEVDVKQAMRGAMRGLADGLDIDSAFLTPELVKTYESNTNPGPADIGVDIIRQYYLRIISARDGSPAAKAGLRTGDYIRAIDGKATRDMSAFEGARLLHGAAGSKVTLLIIRGNAADPHEVTLTRERPAGTEVTSKMADASTGYVRVYEFSKDSAAKFKQTFESLAKSGATRYVIDLRGTSKGDLDDGLAAARLFVKSGTLAVKQSKTTKETVSANAGDGAISSRLVLVTNPGTSGAAEVFAAALDGNKRAELVGERTLGRAARQRLVKLPDGSGLLLSVTRYQTPDGKDIHEKGLMPEVAVDEPDVEFGSTPPPGDPILDRALKIVAGDITAPAPEKKAA
ncbi:MAG TPA: S41 family peptidase [Vicinamibacterales bacterium]|nr:S41 family peptidase [Vicinamibacterales bacterium]